MTTITDKNEHEIILLENQELFLPILWTGCEPELSYTILLQGNDAHVNCVALLIGNAKQRLSLKITIKHIGLRTKSTIRIKSILQDKAQIAISGMINIIKGARRADAWLASYMLLLSGDAKGIALPALEIAENNVKAGHAATVDKVNEIQLFYLMSRGLSSASAKKLIIQGFIQEMLDIFPDSLKKEAKGKLSVRDTVNFGNNSLSRI